MRHLFLHVGMHKTGSTSIQTTFFLNRQLLAAAGIRYLEASRSHAALIETGFGAGIPGAAVLPDHAREARERIAAFLRNAPEGAFLLSAEDMSRMEAEEIEGLIAFLRPLVGRISVVCFVRPPRGYITSRLQQAIRSGAPLARLRTIAPPNYRRQIEKFIAAAGRENLLLTLYDRAVMPRGCAIATMLAICGAPTELYDRLDIRHVNASLSEAGAALLLAMLEAGLPTKQSARTLADRLCRHQALQLAEALPGPRFRVPEPMLQALLARPAVQADIAWIEAEMGCGFPGSPDEDGGLRDASGWPESRLTSLDRPAVATLHGLLRNKAELARASAWIEDWLASRPAETEPFLPRVALQELAALLTAALRGTPSGPVP